MLEVREEATVGAYETRTPVSHQHENIALWETPSVDKYQCAVSS